MRSDRQRKHQPPVAALELDGAGRFCYHHFVTACDGDSPLSTGSRESGRRFNDKSWSGGEIGSSVTPGPEKVASLLATALCLVKDNIMLKFLREIPQPQSGVFYACVVFQYRDRPEQIVWYRKVKGLRRAYVLAHIVSTWYDLIHPFLDVGIKWQVKSGPQSQVETDVETTTEAGGNGECDEL